MNIEAMRQLERVMTEVVEQKKPFDMGSFTGITSCDTSHCVAGWAMEDPWFKEQGLTPGMGGVPLYQELSNGEALEKFFGLSWDSTNQLFYHPNSTAQNQLEYIRTLIGEAS